MPFQYEVDNILWSIVFRKKIKKFQAQGPYKTPLLVTDFRTGSNRYCDRSLGPNALLSNQMMPMYITIGLLKVESSVNKILHCTKKEDRHRLKHFTFFFYIMVVVTFLTFIWRFIKILAENDAKVDNNSLLLSTLATFSAVILLHHRSTIELHKFCVYTIESGVNATLLSRDCGM